MPVVGSFVVFGVFLFFVRTSAEAMRRQRVISSSEPVSRSVGVCGMRSKRRDLIELISPTHPLTLSIIKRSIKLVFLYRVPSSSVGRPFLTFFK